MTGSLIVSWYTVTSFRGTKNEFWVQALPAAQDDTLSYRFVATQTLASPVRKGGGKPRRDRRWRLAEVACEARR